MFRFKVVHGRHIFQRRKLFWWENVDSWAKHDNDGHTLEEFYLTYKNWK